MEGLFGIFILFGLGILALIILISSAKYSRGRAAVIVWGIIAVILMILECIFLKWLADIGFATSGSSYDYNLISIPIVVFIFSLLFYFFAVFDRLMGRK